tara:strand:- start:284 stop:568 length:285 start_codon:yes stop_codon:yes gene_type:complete
LEQEAQDLQALQETLLMEMIRQYLQVHHLQLLPQEVEVAEHKVVHLIKLSEDQEELEVAEALELTHLTLELEDQEMLEATVPLKEQMVVQHLPT